MWSWKTPDELLILNCTTVCFGTKNKIEFKCCRCHDVLKSLFNLSTELWCELQILTAGMSEISMPHSFLHQNGRIRLQVLFRKWKPPLSSLRAAVLRQLLSGERLVPFPAPRPRALQSNSLGNTGREMSYLTSEGWQMPEDHSTSSEFTSLYFDLLWFVPSKESSIYLQYLTSGEPILIKMLLCILQYTSESRLTMF